MATERDICLMSLGSDMHHEYNFAIPSSRADENAFPKPAVLEAVSSKAISSHPTVVTSTVGLIHVLGYNPGEGEQGVPITANINFSCQVGPAVRVRLVVGRRAIATQVRELVDQTYGRWQLEGTVPPFVRQPTAYPKVLLTVQAVNFENVVLDSVTFGEFTYWEFDRNYAQPHVYTKRIQDDDAVEDIKSPLPRHLLSSKRSGRDSPTATQVSEQRRSRVQHRSKLYRRSNFTATRRKRSGTSLPDEHKEKAVLRLLSPIQSLSQGWDATELQIGRRLVRFRGVLEGSNLQVTCEGIEQEDYHDGDIVVSCIYRDDEDSCCITSVDIIYLLEKLVDDEFEVEEKNRIRRNLEGFRPTTVSKHKSGFEGFFQRIMDFPDPKPRNIEKDVKVFDWALLPQALDKIISKYSLYYFPSEEFVPHSIEVPANESSTSSPCSSSEDRHSNTECGNQLISSPCEAQLTYPSDESFPAIYVNPALVDKYYIPPPNNVTSIADATSHMPGSNELSTSNAFATSSVSFAVASDPTDSLNRGSHSSWNIDLVKAESPGDPDFFEIHQTQEGADSYRIDGDGLHTYDSLEFQTLREHNLECSYSNHSL